MAEQQPPQVQQENQPGDQQNPLPGDGHGQHDQQVLLPQPQQEGQQPQQGDQQQQQQQKELEFSNSITKKGYINNRFCHATGTAGSDYDERKSPYYMPMIEEIEDQAIKNVEETLKKCECGIETLKGIISGCDDKTNKIRGHVDEKKKEIEGMVKKQIDMINEWERSVLKELESEYGKVNDEIVKIKTDSEELRDSIEKEYNSVKEALDKLKKREMNGDEAMEQLHESVTKLEKDVKSIEEINEKVCVEYKFEFLPKNVFDDVFDFSCKENVEDMKRVIVMTKDLGKNYIEAKLEDQKGEHKEIAYVPDEKFLLKCDIDGHKMSEKVFFHEAEKKWYCLFCEKDGVLRCDKIVGEKKTKFDKVCEEIKKSCDSISSRNTKNAENEKGIIKDKAEKEKEINAFFANEHKKLDIKRTEILSNLEKDFKAAFDDVRKEHERLRLYLKEGNNLLALAEKTSRDYVWAMEKKEMSYKPIQQLIRDVKYLHDKSEILAGKVSSLESDSKAKYMKIEFNHPDDQKIEEGVNALSAKVSVIPEQ